MINKVIAQVKRFNEPVIACLGLAYKADIDDLRESPAVDIVAQLIQQTSDQILIVEPHVDNLPQKLSSTSSKLCTLEHALEHADIIVLLVDHSEFRTVDRERLNEKVIIDTKGVWR